MIDIIETQKRWGRDFCFRMAKQMSHEPVAAFPKHGPGERWSYQSDITYKTICIIGDMKPGVLIKTGPCFWKFLTYIKAYPVMRACDICGELKWMNNIKSGIPGVCKKCSPIKVSATRQGIDVADWKGYVTDAPIAQSLMVSVEKETVKNTAEDVLSVENLNQKT